MFKPVGPIVVIAGGDSENIAFVFEIAEHFFVGGMRACAQAGEDGWTIAEVGKIFCEAKGACGSAEVERRKGVSYHEYVFHLILFPLTSCVGANIV